MELFAAWEVADDREPANKHRIEKRTGTAVIWYLNGARLTDVSQLPGHVIGDFDAKRLKEILEPATRRLLALLLENRVVSKIYIEQALWPEIEHDAAAIKRRHYLSVLRRVFDGRITSDGDSVAFIGEIADVSPDLAEPGIPLTTFDMLPSLASGSTSYSIRFLHPRYRAVPFIQHNDEIEDLWNWISCPESVSFQAIVGPGGRGKTRLSVALLELMRLRSRRDWHAGFLDGDTTTKDMLSFGRFATWNSKPTLIILDDAARWVSELTQVVKAIASRPTNASKLRFLLIDRGSDDEYGWYGQLRTTAEAQGVLDDFFPRPLRLRPFDSSDGTDNRQRFKLLDSALAKLAEITGRARVALTDACAPYLSVPEMGDPLVLLMAAMVVHERGDPSPLTWRRLKLAEYLAAREIVRVDELSKNRKRLPLHMAAYATLCGGLERSELAQSCRKERTKIDDHSWDSAELTTFLEFDALPSDDSSVAAAAITPDLVGEVFIDRVLSSPHEDGKSTVVRAFRQRPAAVAHTLVRMIQDFGLSESEQDLERQRRTLSWFSGLIGDNVKLNESELWSLHLAIPLRSAAMTSVARDFYRRIVRFPGTPLPLHAAASSGLARFEHAVGNDTEALRHAQVAYRAYVDLAVIDAAGFEHERLIAMLHYQSALRDNGKRQEAAELSKQALQLATTLVDLHARSSRMLALLAHSQMTRANRLREAGSLSEALNLSIEAVQTSHELVSRDRPRYLSILAGALDGNARCWQDLGDLHQALSAARQSVQAMSEAAALNPDQHLDGLAESLKRQSFIHRSLGQEHEAAECTRQQIQALQQVRQGNPQGYVDNLASAYANLGNIQANTGQEDEALELYEKAIVLFRQLNTVANVKGLNNHTKTLAALANLYTMRGASAEALKLIEEILLYQAPHSGGLDERTPDVIFDQPRLLWTKALALSDLNRVAEALNVNAEAAQYSEQLVRTEGTRGLIEKARCYFVWSRILSKANLIQEAIDKLAVALCSLKPYAIASPSSAEWRWAVDVAGEYEKTCLSVGAVPDVGLTAPFSITIPSGLRGDELACRIRHLINQSPLEHLQSVAQSLEKQPFPFGLAQQLAEEARERYQQLAKHSAQASITILHERLATLNEAIQRMKREGNVSARLALLEGIPILVFFAERFPREYSHVLEAALTVEAEIKKSG